MSDVLALFECDCMCHAPGSFAVHCMPCCSECERCKKNIRNGWMSQHREECEANFAKIEAEYNDIMSRKEV